MNISKQFFVLLLLVGILTQLLSAQEKYQPSQDDLAELNKNLLKLEKDEKKFGKGTFGTLSSLQEVAGSYAAIQDKKCLEYIEKCYEVVKSIKEKKYFNISDNNVWLIEPKIREGYYYYQTEDFDKAQKTTKEALNLCYKAGIDADEKARTMEKILTMVESFRDGDVLKYGADLENKLLQSNLISAENVGALKEAIKVNNINAQNFSNDKKKVGNLIGKSFKEVLKKVRTSNLGQVINEQAPIVEVPDFITDYEKNQETFFSEIKKDKAKANDNINRLTDILKYYSSCRNFSKLEEIINKSEDLYDNIHCDDNIRVLFGEEIVHEAVQYYTWIGNYAAAKDILEKWNEKINSNSKNIDPDKLQSWKYQYNIYKAAIASSTGNRPALDESVIEIIKLNDAVSKNNGRPTSHAINQIAGFYASIGDDIKALEYYSSALKDLQEWRQSIENKELSKKDTEPEQFRKILYEWKESSDMLHENLLGILDSSQKTGNWKQAIDAESSINAFCNDFSKEEYDVNQDYETLALFALNSVHAKDSRKALMLMRRIIDAKNSNLENILLLPEDDLLSFQIKNYDLSLPAATLDPNNLFDLIVKQKGVVNDVLIKRNSAIANTTPEDLRKTAILRSAIAQLIQKGNSSDSKKQLDSLRESLLSIERKNAKILDFQSLKDQVSNISLEKILKTLQPNQAYIEIYKYRPVCETGFSDEVYAALIANCNSCNVTRIELGSTDKINSLIEQYTKTLESGNSVSFQKINDQLFITVVDPLLKNTGTNTMLYISPEGNFNFLPIAAIAASDGAFVGEMKNINYVTTARDFVRPARLSSHSRMAIFYNPDFNYQQPENSNSVSITGINSDQYNKIALSPLPGTAIESDMISEIASSNSVALKQYEGINASEANLKSLDDQDIVHLGTHGFYLKSFHSTPNSSRGLKVVSSINNIAKTPTLGSGVDPMRSSGIALSGAQKTLTCWANNIAPNPYNDGILTAEEVASINFTKSWLITLSACETGRGESVSGEGVFGFRRAFFIAGAQNLLMTLWPVSDEVTPRIMADFYKKALATGDAAGSLSDVQRDWLVKLRNEKGLLAAVRDAGPFAMVVMANPNAKQSSDTNNPSNNSLQNAQSPSSTPPQVSPDALADCVQKTQSIMDQKIQQNAPSIQDLCTGKFKKLLKAGLYAAPGEQCALDADFRYDTQDDYPKINSSGPAVQNGEKISVPVELQFGTNAPFSKTWVFTEENGTWLLDDVLTQKSGESSAKSMAEDLSKLPNAPEVASSPTPIPTATAPEIQRGISSAVLDFNEALAKADAGDAYAQGVVSIYFTMGYKTPKDVGKGLSYAMKSASQKNPLGIFQVGILRELGVGMKKSKKEGHVLMSNAFDGLNAMTGDPYALYDLGMMALEGVGVDQNPKEAARLFKASADMGYAPAQRIYSIFLEKGGIVPQDLQESAKYRRDYQSQWPSQQ